MQMRDMHEARRRCRMEILVLRSMMMRRAPYSLRRAGGAWARGVLVAVALSAPGASALAQDNYPNRPVKIIAPQAPGGGVDLVARTIGDRLSIAVGQPLVLDNPARAGGGSAP